MSKIVMPYWSNKINVTPIQFMQSNKIIECWINSIEDYAHTDADDPESVCYFPTVLIKKDDAKCLIITLLFLSITLSDIFVVTEQYVLSVIKIEYCRLNVQL